MTLKELNKLIRDSVETLTGVSAIAYYPNAPRPRGDYATVNIASIAKVGGLSKKFENAARDVIETIVMLYQAQISVNFYRENARNNAAFFAGLLARNDIVEAFNLVGAGLINISDTRDLTEVFTHEHEERAQVDITVQFELDPAAIEITGIESVPVNGEIENHTGVIDNVEIIIGG